MPPVGASSSFPQTLRRLRLRAGLTQEQLAELAGLSVRAISDLERDSSRTPRASTVSLLSAALSLSDGGRRDLAESIHSNAPVAQPGLPRFLTPLIGRSVEVKTLTRLLDVPETQLISLTGPGGVGKTRVAVAVADRMGRAMFIDLASVTVAHMVLPAIAQRLGVDDIGRLGAALRGTEHLLVLDNFEQVIEAGPDVVELLRECPGVRMLVTSRVPLRVRGEREFRLAPLRTPLAGELDPTAAAACHLFLDRAAAAGHQVTADETTDVAEVTRRLGGLPLALELAAARLGVLGVSELLAQLDRTLPVLTDGPLDLPDRQRTMRDTVAWSHALLTETGQIAFRRMAACAGGGAVAELATVCEVSADDIAEVVRAGLAGIDREDRDRRITMLVPMREFGLEQLAAAGETDRVLARLADLVVAHWSTHPTRYQAVELGNLRAAVTWAVDTGRAETAHLLLTAAVDGLLRLGALDEGYRLATNILDVPGPTPAEVRAEAQIATLRLAVALWDLPSANRYADAAVLSARAVSDPVLTARALVARGWSHRIRNDYRTAVIDFSEAVALAESADDDVVRLSALHGLTYVTLFSGDFESGRRINDVAGELAVRLGDEHGRAQHLMMRAWLESHAGRWHEAARWGELAVDIFDAHHDLAKTAEALRTLGDALSYAAGTVGRARDLLEESRRLYAQRGEESIAGQVASQQAFCSWQLGDRSAARAQINLGLATGRRFEDLWAIAMCTTLLGHFELVDGDREYARNLLHEGEAAFNAIGNPLYARWIHEGLAALAAQDGVLDTARERLAVADRLRTMWRTPPIDAELLAHTRAAVEPAPSAAPRPEAADGPVDDQSK